MLPSAANAWSNCSTCFCASALCCRNCATTLAKFDMVSLGRELYQPTLHCKACRARFDSIQFSNSSQIHQEECHETPRQRSLPNPQIAFLLRPRQDRQTQTDSTWRAASRRSSSSPWISGIAVAGRNAKTAQPKDPRTSWYLRDLPRRVHGL